MEELVKSIANEIRQKIKKQPEIAVILGSGLSELLDNMQNKVIIPYSSLNGMLLTKVEGHKNQFVVGQIGQKTVIAMQGRFHLYDGFSPKEVCLPIYVFKELGVKTLIVTNASGAVNPKFKPGEIVLLTDHINHTGQNALVGGAIINYGVQFVDMSEPYDAKYREIVTNLSAKFNISIKTGVYMQFIGPFYETKADIKMARILGADLVGMSTVLEVESARQCNLRVLGLSVATNMATGVSAEHLSHDEVLQNSKIASKNLTKLVDEFIKQI